MIKRFAQLLISFTANDPDIVSRVININNDGSVQEFQDPGNMSGSIQIEVKQNTVCTVTTAVTDNENIKTTSPVATYIAGNLDAPLGDTINLVVTGIIEREVPDEPV